MVRVLSCLSLLSSFSVERGKVVVFEKASTAIYSERLLYSCTFIMTVLIVVVRPLVVCLATACMYS